MKTKIHIIIGEASHEVPNSDLRNWDEIEYTLERKDYSGVMRSFSSEFRFVGAAFTLLRDLYLADGFLAAAEVSVSTKNDDWTYTEQFRCPLDFSTVEIEDETLAINAIDNTLSALIKSKKGQKYEYRIADMPVSSVVVNRLQMRNNASFTLSFDDGRDQDDWIDMLKDSSGSAVISEGYFKLYDEIAVARTVDQTTLSVNSFFAEVIARGADLNISLNTSVLCKFYDNGTPSVSRVDLIRLYEDDGENVREVLEAMFDDDITSIRRGDRTVSAIVGGSRSAVYASLSAMKRAAGTLFEGKFGIVGSHRTVNSADYLDNNTVYEFDGTFWVEKGSPRNYTQRREIFREVTIEWGDLFIGDYLSLTITGTLNLYGGTVNLYWADPLQNTVTVRGVTPLALATSLVQSIAPGSSVEIDADDAGLITDTYIIPAETLRNIPGAKLYSTFQQFADWMGAVFGYTYRVDGDTLRFLHRSDAFSVSSVKAIEHVRGVKYSVNDNLIYSTVEAGYSKKDYGEIDGRFETNFTNYYATVYNATDRKLSLISKYRADSYGIEFTLRKGENKTEDDKSDEDVFFVLAPESGITPVYEVGNNDAFNPAVCVANNAGFIAAMGNGKVVTLEMTSSDGNNALADIAIAAGSALFSAGVLEFTTDDMVEPSDLDGLISIDHGGYRYRGFISKASARYGRQNGMDYELIIKDITKL